MVEYYFVTMTTVVHFVFRNQDDSPAGMRTGHIMISCGKDDPGLDFFSVSTTGNSVNNPTYLTIYNADSPRNVTPHDDVWRS